MHKNWNGQACPKINQFRIMKRCTLQLLPDWLQLLPVCLVLEPPLLIFFQKHSIRSITLVNNKFVVCVFFSWFRANLMCWIQNSHLFCSIRSTFWATARCRFYVFVHIHAWMGYTYLHQFMTTLYIQSIFILQVNEMGSTRRSCKNKPDVFC